MRQPALSAHLLRELLGGEVVPFGVAPHSANAEVTGSSSGSGPVEAVFTHNYVQTCLHN